MVTRTERGWAGHFMCANRCRFRRNTLLQYGAVEIVVSTVGLMENYHQGLLGENLFEEIGCGRYYETMAFHANPDDQRYHDADVGWSAEFDGPWSISEVDADDRANEMHERVVREIIDRLITGEYNE